MKPKSCAQTDRRKTSTAVSSWWETEEKKEEIMS